MLTIRQQDPSQAEGIWLGPAPWIVTPPPGPLAIAAISRDERVTSPSYTRPYPLAVRRARGSIVEDLDGNRYLDFTAGIAVCNVGHCHPLVVKAIQQQAGDLLHMCGSDFYYEPMIDLGEKLTEITPGKFAKRVFFTNSGTEAVEAALKLARFHTRRKWVIGFHGAFHGRTLGALSLTASKVKQRARFGPLLPMIAHATYGDLDSVAALFKHEVPAEETAAIVVEPILGEGGYRVPPPEFLRGLRKICDEHGILLVMDEIQTGMGRTGKMFASEHSNVVPDILCVAKGLAAGMPLGAIVASETIMDWPEGVHGSTFGGNPVSCAAALASIELIETNFLGNAARLGSVAIAKLQVLADKYACLADVRGLGLMLAVEVVHPRGKHAGDPRLRDRIVHEAFVRGLLLLGCGESAIRFCPPLCINRTQLEVGLDVLDEVIATVTA